jgi:hypothetical protein
MSKVPYQTSFGTNTSVSSMNITNFISGSTSNPTPANGSYARYQKIGSVVQVQFKYIFSTVGSGNYSINLPLTINGTYSKPQGVAHIRYVGSSTGQVYWAVYNEKNTTSVNIVASTTYGGVPVSFTSSSPNAGLGANDIITGLIFYEN